MTRRIPLRFPAHRVQWLGLACLALTTALIPGLRARVFPARAGALANPDASVRTAATASTETSSDPLPELVALPTGLTTVEKTPPQGWNTLILKPIPRLATGDLGTVSERAFDTAQRIRMLIVADVQKSSSNPNRHVIGRVGVGLCAPAQDANRDVVISSTTVDGTRGDWTTKERIILAAAAVELKQVEIAAATPTFALVRTPVKFLAEGSHGKSDVYYALLADDRSGTLRTLAWRDDSASSSRSAESMSLREVQSPVFDCPIDVQAKRLATIPVAWSFAMSELAPGTKIQTPSPLANLLRGPKEPASAERLETALRSVLDDTKLQARRDVR